MMKQARWFVSWAQAGLLAALAPGCATLETRDMPARTVSPKVVSIHTADASSPKAIVRRIIRPGMTPEEKAIAVWRYCWENTYHWVAPREWPRETHELDVVYDVNKLLNVYGYTYCFAIRAVGEALYEAAGLEARSRGIGGHVIAEVYYDGQYHFLDHDQRGFSRLSDGTIASVEDYRGKAKMLVLNPVGPSRPFFPSTTSPVAIYELKHVFAGYLSNHAVHYAQHDKYRTTHSMNFALRPGERFVRSWQNVGKWHWYPDLTKDYQNSGGYGSPWVGPHDPYGKLYPEAPRDEDGNPLTYGNGLLVYRPNLAAGARDYADGVLAERNMDSGGPGFCPARAGQEAVADFRVRVPYVIVGWPGDITSNNITGAAVISGACVRQSAADAVEILVSNNGGAEWESVWKSKDTGRQEFAVDVSNLVEGRYEYVVRFRLQAAEEPGGARIEQFGLDTAFQLNPQVLPAVRPGTNEMTVTFEDGPEVFEESIQYHPKHRAAHERRVREVKDLEFKDGSYTTLGPSKPGGKGHVVYEMPAPDGREIVWARVGGAFRSHHDPRSGEKYRILYAVDRPRGWKPLWEADQAPYLGHWCFEANAEINLDRPAKRVFVKFELERAAGQKSEGGKLVSARLVWGCRQGSGRVPRGGIRLTHSWQADGRDQRHEQIVARSGESYGFDVAARKVRNVSIAMEWAARPPASTGPHPLMLKPPTVQPREIRNLAAVNELEGAVAKLNQSPTLETAVEIMTNCANDWARGAMAPTLMTFGGEKARAALRQAIPKLPGAEGCLLELMTWEGPTAELAEYLSADQADKRATVARLLADRNDPAAVPALEAALTKEKNADALAAAAAALVRLGGADQVADLEQALERCDARGKIEVAAALAARRDRRGLDLLARYAEDPDRYLRYHAAVGLAGSGWTEAESALVRRLTDESRWPRREAIVGLARFGGRASLAALRHMAQKDPQADLRAEAEWAIGRIEARLAKR